MPRANDPRLERLLANIALRTELVRDQLTRARVGGNLDTVILADLEAAHRRLIAAASAGDTFGAVDAAEAVAVVVQRANQVVLRRHRPLSRKQRKAAAVKAFVQGSFAAGRTIKEIIEAGVPRTQVYRLIPKSKRDVGKVKG